MTSSLTEGFEARLARLEDALASACRAAARPRGEVRLVAVSKEQPLASVEAALALGVRDFGENRVHALSERVEALARHPAASSIRWHMIGPVQSRKARELLRLHEGGAALSVQTVDRLSLVAALEGAPAEAPLPVLIQVNVDAEPQKAGCAPGELDGLVDRVLAAPGLRLAGLMAIPAPRGELSLRRAFASLRGLADGIADRVQGRVELSMGMSDDFPWAIAEGATMVRVGSALFGPRPGQAADGVKP